jgi:hypothetical protein
VDQGLSLCRSDREIPRWYQRYPCYIASSLRIDAKLFGLNLVYRQRVFQMTRVEWIPVRVEGVLSSTI